MAKVKKTVIEKAEKNRLSRRNFITVGGTALASSTLAVSSPNKTEAKEQEDYAPSTKYLVYDSKHCLGCYGCMIACSMVHEGQVNFSLSRIQVHRAVLNKYPADILIKVCRQCPEPLCVKNCPTGEKNTPLEIRSYIRNSSVCGRTIPKNLRFLFSFLLQTQKFACNNVP